MNEDDANRLAAAIKQLCYTMATVERNDLLDNIEALITDYRNRIPPGPDSDAQLADAAFNELVKILTETHK